VSTTRTAPASALWSKPGLVLKAQFQLAADHSSPFSLSHNCANGPGSGPAGEIGVNKVANGDIRQCPGNRE
jgi:hypothetical protein